MTTDEIISHLSKADLRMLRAIRIYRRCYIPDPSLEVETLIEKNLITPVECSDEYVVALTNLGEEVADLHQRMEWILGDDQ